VALGRVLHALGQGHGVPLVLAWVYVGARVVQRLPSDKNVIEVRFSLFVLSSLVLVALTAYAALAALAP
jgi:hypothetical protein